MYIERFPSTERSKLLYNTCQIHTLMAEAAMQGDNCSSGGQAGNRTSNLLITRQPALLRSQTGAPAAPEAL